MRTLALVSTEGSLDFLCYPEFDSPSIFAKLLDEARGGSFCIQPELEDYRARQLYLPDTNVLCTRFLHTTGIAELTDFMPVLDVPRKSQVVRIVESVRGKITFRASCAPAFDYGRSAHRVERSGNSLIFTPDTGPRLRLRSTAPLTVNGAKEGRPSGDATFELQSGEQAIFILGCADDETDGCDDPASIRARSEQSFRPTVEYWQSWMGASQYKGRWREMVNRSALALKLLTSRSHGSLLAAPTFSLPEKIGGERNWDYRYSWLRDSAFTIYSFIRLGYVDEAHAFKIWLHDRVSDDAEHGPLQPMYRFDGNKDLDESTLDDLRGYCGSRPVRIGNAAGHQLQLDIYGELMDAIYLSAKYGDTTDYSAWRDVQRVVRWVSAHWQDPDEGIWEVRSGRQAFLHSRVMCWVAMDRAIRLARQRSLPGPLSEWGVVRDRIYDDVFESFWDEERQTFVREKGSRGVDASALLMPLMRFVSPTDPRWLSTMRAIEQELVEGPLVYRYDTQREPDGLRGDEGSFTACSFWYIECLARARQTAKARFLFEKMLGYANHVGLYSEEIGMNGRHLGNFPQAFTHLALISAAYALDSALEGKDLRKPWR